MENESFNFDTVMAERRAAAAESMALISREDLQKLSLELFPQRDHPWCTRFEAFLAEHPISPVVYGTATDGVSFVFFPIENAGLWFSRSGGVTGMGPIQERGLKALSKIATDKAIG